ncbi:ATP-binding cassette domain-containing protein [Chamaesiphon polymorphus]|uniref:Maltooligosyl trehalose synthase n=1 Tax=Chamaesiphon polymorphus CCALA 037 TaxID=2107692 RepID=A0A2T1FWB2_9CYAN|nr:ATP-binding cassette domain-containing protein [Chamaesiphon polymorphus]PSB49272.1 maltooligosyl trehalose synthase [Chamaesiphon polymorphus CCALA 037]
MVAVRTVFDTTPRIEMHWQDSFMSFDLTQDEHDLGREPAQPPPIGLVVPIEWELVSRRQAIIRKIDSDYYIYDGDGQNSSSNRLFLNNRLITPNEGYCLQSYDELRIGQDPQNYATLTYIDPTDVRIGSAPIKTSMSLALQQTITIGRSEDNNFVLDAPTISRHHAAVQRTSSGRYLLHNYSPNGVFVDRQQVDKTAPLEIGSIIQIGPYTFVLRTDALTIADRGDNIRLDVDGITKIVKLKDRQSLCLLNNVTLAIEPGQFVALVGGSGAGKSTLMQTLLGIQQPTVGMVYLNGDNLVNNFNIYRNSIGYVPQSDIVHKNLTVREVLYYAARMRLPPDIDIDSILANTLGHIELTQRQHNLVKNLSGGQLKRVSIGVELLADPNLFFLDEPTSGLDPGLDKKMMQLLRRLADEGRTVVLVTHATSNINLCDRVAFMGLGGNLCYFGPPATAKEFFAVPDDFADIYIKLETAENCLDAAARFQDSDYYRTNIQERLSLPTHGGQSKSNRAILPLPERGKQSFFQQIQLLIRRYIQLLRRDPVYLGLSLLTAPIGILLVWLATKDTLQDTSKVFDAALNPVLTPFVGSANVSRAGMALKILFVFTCANVWVGLASSLQEIIKESAIYLRERLVNLGLFAYVGSKLLTLGGLAIAQTILISAIVFLCFQQPEPVAELAPINWWLGMPITTFLSILDAVCLGLMVSASVKNSAQANSALPLLLLPQIIFAGVLFGLDKVPIGRFVSWLTISRWSIGAYGTLIDLNILIPTSKNDAGIDFSQMMKPSSVYDTNWQNLSLNWGMLIFQSVFYLGVTIWLQKRKDLLKSPKRQPSSSKKGK